VVRCRRAAVCAPTGGCDLRQIFLLTTIVSVIYFLLQRIVWPKHVDTLLLLPCVFFLSCRRFSRDVNSGYPIEHITNSSFESINQFICQSMGCFGSVWCRTSNQKIVSSTPGRCIAG